MRTVKNSTLICVLALTGLTTLLIGDAANAFPAFAQKEKKPCSYCHVNPGGGGRRNAAGIWYDKHGQSFAGYTPEQANAEAGLNARGKTTASPTPKAVSKAVSKAIAKAAPKKPAKPAAKKPTAKPGAKKNG